MLDFILGLALAGMLVRGWARGFVREFLDLVGLVLGIWLAFRLSGPVGNFMTDSFGVSPELARIGSGVLLFVLFGASLSIAAHYLAKVMNLPGLSMVNRVGGAAVAVIWGVAVALVALTLTTLFPLPDSWRDQIDDSRVAQAVIGAETLPQRTFEALAGDNVLAAIAAIQDLFGSSRVVPEGNESVEIPSAPPDETRQVRDEADDLLLRINEYRVGMGLSAVRPVQMLVDVAESHATGRYSSGKLSRLPDCRKALADLSYQVLSCDNAVALAGTSVAAFHGMLESTSGETMFGGANLDRVGVSVVDGPTGRVVVVILAA